MAGILGLPVPQVQPGGIGGGLLSGIFPTLGQQQGVRIADAGGGSVPPIEIENMLTAYAQGKMTAAQVQKGMPTGWTVNLRSRLNPIPVNAPNGDEHMVHY